MRNKIWYLSTCDKCMRVISELGLVKGDKRVEFIDLKNNPIDEESLDLIKEILACSYEDLFNKRAQKYTKTDLKNKLKDDLDFKREILKEYTFIKRPIISCGKKFFVDSKISKSILEIKKLLN